MPISPTQVLLVGALLVALAYAHWVLDVTRYRDRLTDRLLFGVPWGTLVTVALVLAFYLFAQGGLRNWDEPVVFAFVSWSYFYPEGLLTAGVAHGSPAHIRSNLVAALVLGSIAEYAWGHYPPRETARTVAGVASGWRDGSGSTRDDGQDRPGDGPLGESRSSDGTADDVPLRERPAFRAVVVFPAVLLALAVVTSVFSLQPSIGFSGAVFAILGFALVQYPVGTILAMIAVSALNLVYSALANPTVTGALERGPPQLPDWAGIAFQAHAVGFLLGVLLGLALLRRRSRQVDPLALLGATLLLGALQGLYVVSWPTGDDAYTLYRGLGVIAVVLVAVAISASIAASDRDLPRPLSVLPWAPTRRILAGAWLVVLTLFTLLMLGAALTLDDPLALTFGPFFVLAVLLALPAIVPFLPGRVRPASPTRRQAAVVFLVALVVVLALPSGLTKLTVVGDDPVPGSGEMEIEGYAITYEENATVDRQFPFGDVETEDTDGTTQSGVIVVDEDRHIWTIGVQDVDLAYSGEASVAVGGIGSHAVVDAERTGWEVPGAETVYAVDLHHDGSTMRSFWSEPVTVHEAVGGYAVGLVPGEDAFSVRLVEQGDSVAAGDVVDETAVPDAGTGADLGPFEVVTETTDDVEHVYLEGEDTRVHVATEETYE